MADRPRFFQVTYPNAAGIDIGAASHSVAVPPDRDGKPAREFPRFTADLEKLADWLAARGVGTVAMEGSSGHSPDDRLRLKDTGVYWIPLFELVPTAQAA